MAKKTILSALIGFFLGIYFAYIWHNGFFERWENVPASTIQDDIEFYLPLTGEDSFENPPCDYSSPAFSIISNSPRDITTCVQNITWYPEADNRSIYVIDSKGNYWLWSHFSVINDYMLVYPPLFGIVIGAFISGISTRPSRKDAE